MTAFVLVVAVTAFLSGAASAAFLLLVIGIRKADRSRSRAGDRTAPLDAVTRTFLAGNTWPGSPVVHGGREAD